jgi:cob(I)alamin adenosyltransferase
MKIYTKTGDKGSTSLIGGKRVPKSHVRLEAYGTVDELIAYIGLLRDVEVAEKQKKELVRIQDRLMICASILATDEGAESIKLPKLHENDITALETAMDEMENGLPPLNSFILPGGHTSVSFCHIARTVCRRAERQAIRLSQEFEIEEIAIRYLNRLSDYLFMLSRRISFDLKVTEIPWIPEL